MFSMPDTVYNKTAFSYYPTYDFGMGLFQTDMPERFGVLANRRIVNKKPLGYFEDDPPYDAWGVLTWTSKCVELWQAYCPGTYTEAFNDAIETFGCAHWKITDYYDFATHADYLNYFKDEPEEEKPIFVLDGRQRP